MQEPDISHLYGWLKAVVTSPRPSTCSILAQFSQQGRCSLARRSQHFAPLAALAGLTAHDDYAYVIAAQVPHTDLHSTDLDRGPLPRRERTCRGLLGPGREA